MFPSLPQSDLLIVCRVVFHLWILVSNGLTVALNVLATADLLLLLESHLKSGNQVKLCVVVQIDCVQNHACFALVLNVEVVVCLSCFIVVLASVYLL